MNISKVKNYTPSLQKNEDMNIMHNYEKSHVLGSPLNTACGAKNGWQGMCDDVDSCVCWFS